jgi:hypothetical protein
MLVVVELVDITAMAQLVVQVAVELAVEQMTPALLFPPQRLELLILAVVVAVVVLIIKMARLAAQAS